VTLGRWLLRLAGAEKEGRVFIGVEVERGDDSWTSELFKLHESVAVVDRLLGAATAGWWWPGLLAFFRVFASSRRSRMTQFFQLEN
jgi:hypothetical protein